MTPRRLVACVKDEVRPEGREDRDEARAPWSEEFGRLGTGVELLVGWLERAPGQRQRRAGSDGRGDLLGLGLSRRRHRGDAREEARMR